MKPMIFIISALLSVNVFAGPMMKLVTQAQVDTYLKDGKFNGVVLVAKDKKLLMKKAYGVKNIISNTPLTVNDKFQIGSVSKQFTAVAILKLQEEGKLSLDDKVTKYLPQYQNYKNISIKDLLNHTSGIPNYTDQPDFWKDLNHDHIISMDEILDFIVSYKLEFEVQKDWKYSNTNYIIAGKIVELVSGEAWNQNIKNNFLMPLKMQDTGYVDFFETVSDVEGYVSGSDPIVGQLNMSWAASAGGLYSTVDDLLKWTDIYADSNLLNESSQAQMKSPFLKNYGLGISIYPFGNESLINHSGRTPGFVTDVNYLTKSKLKVITLDNMDGVNITASDILLRYFTQGEIEVVKNAPYTIADEKLKDYVGTYTSPNMNIKVSLDLVSNKLELQPDGQRAYILTPNDLDSFKLENISGEEFIRDNKGEVVGIKHYQQGNVSEFKKISSVTKMNSMTRVKKQKFFKIF